MSVFQFCCIFNLSGQCGYEHNLYDQLLFFPKTSDKCHFSYNLKKYLNKMTDVNLKAAYANLLFHMMMV
uniref:Uncharacterized protein n=2 Tax=Cercopithecinae TaxID=9528 RepID=A0A8D2G3M9_THEGE|nr:unnamed protein product [Macaca fascicularis]